MKQEKINKIIKELDELKSFTESHIVNKIIIEYVTDNRFRNQKRHRHYTCRRSKKQDFLQ